METIRESLTGVFGKIVISWILDIFGPILTFFGNNFSCKPYVRIDNISWIVLWNDDIFILSILVNQMNSYWCTLLREKVGNHYLIPKKNSLEKLFFFWQTSWSNEQKVAK